MRFEFQQSVKIIITYSVRGSLILSGRTKLMNLIIKLIDFFLGGANTWIFPSSLVMKEEATDFLEQETIKNLVRKYSQFINFPIYVWSSKVSHTYFIVAVCLLYRNNSDNDVHMFLPVHRDCNWKQYVDKPISLSVFIQRWCETIVT